MARRLNFMTIEATTHARQHITCEGPLQIAPAIIVGF